MRIARTDVRKQNLGEAGNILGEEGFILPQDSKEYISIMAGKSWLWVTL